MNPAIVWLIVAVVMIIFELLTLGNLVSVWFALGAMVACLVSMVVPSVPVQVLVFVFVSLVSLVLIRPIASRFLRGNVTATNAESIIGQNVYVYEAIDEDHWGLVKLNGSTWSATTADHSYIKKGALVVIVAIEGVKLIVKQIEEN